MNRIVLAALLSLILFVEHGAAAVAPALMWGKRFGDSAGQAGVAVTADALVHKTAQTETV